ncbi:tetratricopeptide repeat protein [Catenulispora subtropica]|uniref:tetratricopeptide repeat protein n=1 Tax=Catenulispora subtropica TaxID=450798 RepID=UPI0031DAE094
MQTVVVDAAGEKWLGSGYLATAELVLTAEHVLHGAQAAEVRFVDAPGQMRKLSADVVFADARADVAVLRLKRPETRGVPALVFGRPAGPVDCDALGFPRFKLNNDHRAADVPGEGLYRDTYQAAGVCHPEANRYAGTLEVTVSVPPGPDPDGASPWQGMSGAAVFAGGTLIAMLTEHHLRQGPGMLTAFRVDGWYRLLDPRKLADLARLIGLPETMDELAVVRDVGARWETATGGPSMSLPRDVANYTGRAETLDELIAVLDEPAPVLRIHAIDGMAGVGKTTFAVHAAHHLASRFPDGQWFVRLHAHTPGVDPADPDQVLGTLLTADGVTGNLPDGPARAGLWRARTAGRRMLLVLDDALNSAQVRPLLPSAPGTLVLVTSRRPLTGLADATVTGLEVLSSPQACALFTRIVGRRDLRPDDPQVVRLVGLCGHLPLAIGIIAARLRHHRSWSAEDLVDEVTAVGPLPALIGEDESVATAFHLSYRDLNFLQQQMFRLLGASPGIDTDVGAAAAMLEVDPLAAKRLLQDLEEHHLLDEPTRGRYRMHDLVREYARTLPDADPEHSRTAVDRLLVYYQRTAAEHRLHGTEAELSWLRGERPNLLACVEYAADRGRNEALITLTADLAPLLLIEGPWSLAKTLHARAIGAAERCGNRPALATALDNLGRVQSMTGDYTDAIESLEPALVLFRQSGDQVGQAATLNDLGRMRYKVGDYPGANRDLEQALELARGNEDPTRWAAVLHDLGRLRSKNGDRAGALRDQQQALEIYEDVDDGVGLTAVLIELGLTWPDCDDTGAIRYLNRALDQAQLAGNLIGQVDALYGLGTRSQSDDHDRAIWFLQQSLELARHTGDRFGQANALYGLGTVLRRAGDYDGAIRFLEQSLELACQMGHRLGQAEALEEQGECLASTERATEAVVCLRRALDIYRGLGLHQRDQHVAARLAAFDLENTDSPN